MKCSNLSKIFAASVLASSLAILPLAVPAGAQTSNGTDTTNSAPRSSINNSDYNRGADYNNNHDHGGYWGLLGLIGLLGLGGMARGKRSEPMAHRSTDDVSSTTYHR